MKSLRLYFFLFLITCVSTGNAQPLVSDLDQYFQQALTGWEVPGMAVAILKDGEVVLSRGYGVLESGGADPVDGNTLFAIASNTKAFIATAIGILAEEGKLDLDDPVQQYLPYFALYDDYVSRHTTVRDLLCHRSGLGTFSGDVIWYKSEYTAEEVVRKTRYVPQAFEFRAGYGYSNLMFIAAGEVIRAVSGKSWDQFVRERIFDPLGMDRTRTSVEALKMMENVATPHKPDEKGNLPIPYANWDNMGAAGGILSSVNDMAKWLQLQLDEGQFRETGIFSPATQNTLWTPHNSFSVSAVAAERFRNRHFSGYGLGWSLFDYQGRMVATHSGGYDGMYSRVAVMPEEDLAVVVLTNSMKGIGTYLMYRVFDQFLDIEPADWSEVGLQGYHAGQEQRKRLLEDRRNKRIEGAQPALSPESCAGAYYDPMYGEIEVKNEGGKMRLLFPGAPALNATLTHWHYDTYLINWDEEHAWFDFGTVQFVTDNNRQVLELRFDVPNGDIFFEEIHAKRKER